jgi:hypothetical protein
VEGCKECCNYLARAAEEGCKECCIHVITGGAEGDTLPVQMGQAEPLPDVQLMSVLTTRSRSRTNLLLRQVIMKANVVMDGRV